MSARYVAIIYWRMMRLWLLAARGRVSPTLARRLARHIQAEVQG